MGLEIKYPLIQFQIKDNKIFYDKYTFVMVFILLLLLRSATILGHRPTQCYCPKLFLFLIMRALWQSTILSHKSYTVSHILFHIMRAMWMSMILGHPPAQCYYLTLFISHDESTMKEYDIRSSSYKVPLSYIFYFYLWDKCEEVWY